MSNKVQTFQGNFIIRLHAEDKAQAEAIFRSYETAIFNTFPALYAVMFDSNSIINTTIKH